MNEKTKKRIQELLMLNYAYLGEFGMIDPNSVDSLKYIFVEVYMHTKTRELRMFGSEPES